MNTDSNTRQASHVEAAIVYAAQLRDDWTVPELQAAVELSRRHQDSPTDDQVARALMRAAADLDVRRPGYVPASRYWKHLDRDDQVDDGRSSTAPHECRSCGQPGSTAKPPAYCPSCGDRWDPITPDGDDASDRHAGTTLCTSCQHRQVGRFDYCSRCGAAMSYAAAAPRPATPEQPALPGT